VNSPKALVASRFCLGGEVAAMGGVRGENIGKGEDTVRLVLCPAVLDLASLDGAEDVCGAQTMCTGNVLHWTGADNVRRLDAETSEAGPVEPTEGCKTMHESSGAGTTFTLFWRDGIPAKTMCGVEA